MGMMLANRVDFLGPVSAAGWATLRDANVRVRGSGHVSGVVGWVSRRRVPTWVRLRSAGCHPRAVSSARTALGKLN